MGLVMKDAQQVDASRAAPRPSLLRSVYFGHLDGALTSKMYLGGQTVKVPYSLELFTSLLNLHLLLYDRLVAQDIFVLVNPFLRELLVDEYDNARPHHLFLKSGAIVPARSEVAPTFVQLDQRLRSVNSYGHPQIERIRGYAEFLDSISPKERLTYSEQDQRRLMAQVAHTALTSASYTAATKSRTVARTLLAAADSKRFDFPSYSYGGRSWYWRVADAMSAREAAQAEKMRLFSSAALHFSMSSVLKLPPAYPMQIAQLVLPMHAQEPRLLEQRGQEYFAQKLSDHLRVGPSELARLDVDSIVDIRRGSAFRKFRKVNQRVLRESDKDLAAMRLQDGLDQYLVELGDLLSLDLVGARHRYERLQKIYRWVQGISVAGGTALGGAGLVVPLPEPVGPTLSVIGILWGLAGTGAPEWLQHKLAESVQGSRAALLAGPHADRRGLVQISGQSQA